MKILQVNVKNKSCNLSNSALAQLIQLDQGGVNMQIKSGIECGGSEKDAYKDWMVNDNSKCEEKNGNNIIGCDTSSGVDEGDDTESEIASETCDRSKNYKKNRVIKWGNKIVSCVRSIKWYNKMKCICDFVSKLTEMNREERESCLKRLSGRRVMYVSEICMNILNCNVTSDKKYANKIHCHERVIRKLASKRCSLKSKNILLASKDGIEMMHMILPKVSSHLKCVLENFFQ